MALFAPSLREDETSIIFQLATTLFTLCLPRFHFYLSPVINHFCNVFFCSFLPSKNLPTDDTLNPRLITIYSMLCIYFLCVWAIGKRSSTAAEKDAAMLFPLRESFSEMKEERNFHCILSSRLRWMVVHLGDCLEVTGRVESKVKEERIHDKLCCT